MTGLLDDLYLLVLDNYDDLCSIMVSPASCSLTVVRSVNQSWSKFEMNIAIKRPTNFGI